VVFFTLLGVVQIQQGDAPRVLLASKEARKDATLGDLIDLS
jgi:hypothetical protein